MVLGLTWSTFIPAEGPERWRTGPEGDQAHLVPLEAVRALANNPYLLRVQREDGDKIAQVLASMASAGLERPLIVNVDQRGRAVLHDGHHRLVAALALGWEQLPVVFRLVPRIGGFSHSIFDILLVLMAERSPLPGRCF